MDQKHLAVITGDRINEGFFASYYVWPFCRAAKKSGRNNEVTVLPRWPLDEIWLYRRTENVKEVKKLISCWKYGGTPLIRSPMGQKNLAVLTGDRIDKGFFDKKVYSIQSRQTARRPKKVAVITRWLYYRGGRVILFFPRNAFLRADLLRFSQTCEFWSSKANRRLRFSLPSIILTDLLRNKTLL